MNYFRQLERIPLEFVRTASYDLAPIAKGVYVKRQAGPQGLSVSCIQVLKSGTPITMSLYYENNNIEFFHYAGLRPRLHVRQLQYVGSQKLWVVQLYAFIPERTSCRFLVPRDKCYFEDEADFAES